MFSINTDFANANVARTVRFTPKLYDQLSQVCDKHEISFNMLVLQCCRYALDNIDSKAEK